MTDQVENKEVQQPDPLDSFILKFEFPVAAVNAMLSVLGNAPYITSANLIAMIQSQGEPQFKAAMEAEANKEA